MSVIIKVHLRKVRLGYTPFAVRNEPEPILKYPSIRACSSRCRLYENSGHHKIKFFPNEKRILENNGLFLNALGQKTADRHAVFTTPCLGNLLERRRRFHLLSYHKYIPISCTLPVNLAWQWRQSVFYDKMGSFYIWIISILCYGEFMESAILHNIKMLIIQLFINAEGSHLMI